ncbi:MAG: hypothetical protein AAFY57_04475 [Cyanobacteria bacterium J06642_2]
MKFLWSAVRASLLASVVAIASTASAGPLPPPKWGNPTCSVESGDRDLKKQLLQAAQIDPAAKLQYEKKIEAHRAALVDCRERTWPEHQAVWLRLYDYDAQLGVLEDVLDRIVNRGYNRVFVEVFYDGRVLLPVADNPTPWRSVMAEAVAAGKVEADYDLWAEVIRKGRDRGLEIYGWSFALNFGYGYREVPDRSEALARNGAGENSIANARFDPVALGNGKAFYEDAYETEHLFADPYSDAARADLLGAISAIVERDPDGMLFDYVRYPTTFLRQSVVTRPRQLWIYGSASQQALMASLKSERERELMRRFLANDSLSANDIREVDDQFAADPPIFPTDLSATPAERQPRYVDYFWKLAVDHAYRGVLEFVDEISTPARDLNIPVGTVFFPGGNEFREGGYDSKMQPWDRFPSNLQRHPMSYATCPDGICVADQVGEVRNQSETETDVCPVLAGTWGQSFSGHASLEIQMQAIRDRHTQLDCVSHFVYSWMEPDSDKARKTGIGTGD